MVDIKRLMNKKSWTGRELGQLLLAITADEFKQALDGNYDPTPLIPNDEFSAMVQRLQGASQGNTYNNYFKIYEWLKARPAIANFYYLIAQSNFQSIRNVIIKGNLAEHIYRYVEQLPVIVTQKQYDQMKAEGVEAYLTDAESGEELHSDIFTLVEQAIAYYLVKLRNEPQKPNPLKSIRKKYIDQPVKSKLILSRYNEAANKGYYTLGDGRRSDEMTDEEWKAVVLSPNMQAALTDINAENPSGSSLTTIMAEQRLIARLKILYNGGTESDALPVWHTYTDQPKDLTKWDIIEQELLLELYPADIDGSGDAYSDSNFNESMKDFYAEFKDLVDAMLADMDKKYFSEDKIKAAELSLDEWGSTSIGWRRLYELDFYGERSIAESDSNIFKGNYRALLNGVAILRPNDLILASRRIDERGYYTEPNISSAYVRLYSLEAYFTDNENYAEHISNIQTNRTELLSGYYYLKGYNKQIDLIIEMTGVKELEIYKQDVTGLEHSMEYLDDIVGDLYYDIKNTDYQDKELQARKLEVLKDVFPPLDYKSLTIPEENIKEAEELVDNFTAFRQQHIRFEQLLCYRPTYDNTFNKGAY